MKSVLVAARAASLLLVSFLVAGFGARPAFALTTAATFTAKATPAVARPGEIVTVVVTATIKQGYHIYSIVPVKDGPAATELTVKGKGLQPVGKTTESKPERKLDTNFGKEVGYHENTATFTQRVRVPKTAKPGVKIPLTVSVYYMACTEKACLPPKEAVVDGATLAVEAGAPRPQYAASASTTDAGDEGARGAASAAAPAESLVPFLLAAFGAGLLALVTPCVFPMIPVTLAFFTKQATSGTDEAAKAASRGKIVRLAAVYSLGIVLSFTAIGGVLAATIGAAGANRLFTNPWLNLTFAALFVVFGLALLELVELRLPAGLQRMTGAGSRHGGTLGVLGMGFTFVAAAFTCTAPFIGTVLVAAASASSGAQWVRPILGMTVFATALALPFFVLALFPGWLARLPRSGAWLSTVKGAMGFLELAAALKFFGDADRIMGWNLLPQPLFLAIWGILGLAAALWLLGVLRLGFSTPEGRPSPLRAAWAAVFALAGMYCLYGLTGRPIATQLAAFIPPADYGVAGEAASSHTANTVTHNGQVWYKTLEAGLAQAKIENKPIFVDFTGYACTNCRAMENAVFPVPAVQDAFSQFVRVQLYTDGRNDGGASQRNQDYQEKTFGDVALPLYAILSPNGTPSGHIAGQRGAAEFLSFLKTGREKALATQTASAGE